MARMLATMDIVHVPLTGSAVQVMLETEAHPELGGAVLGVDVAGRRIDDSPWVVVQLLLDDDHPEFDPTLLDGPIVAELRSETATDPLVALEPFDHDSFRQQLQAERNAGESETRGVLVTTDGALPPAHIRLAFLPMELADTDGLHLIVRRTTVAELVGGVEQAFSNGEITDDERRSLLIGIEQRHPTPSA
ncbi:MAG: hypothetical protein KDA95_06250 [Acidimicrobiales bacterium]|nr:hypothetical protein [Acidimicrobiales bacterium]